MERIIKEHYKSVSTIWFSYRRDLKSGKGVVAERASGSVEGAVNDVAGAKIRSVGAMVPWFNDFLGGGRIGRGLSRHLVYAVPLSLKNRSR